jgi:HSP20 family protein
MTRKDLDSLFTQGTGTWEEVSTKLASQKAWSPRVDLLEAENHFLIRAELPGVEPAKVTVTYHREKHCVIIRGERIDDMPRRRVRYTPLIVEIESGEFYREVPLPDVVVDGHLARAHWRNGVLSVVLPKEGIGTTITVVETITIRKTR